MSDSLSVWFHTFGCKANQYDTERMRRELEARGARQAAAAAGADVAVINTCTVTNQADANARHLIRRLRRRHPGLRIVVAGCSAAVRAPDYEAMPEVDGVVPGQDPGEVADALHLLGLAETGGVPGGPLARQTRGTRAWLKIQDGCDRKCSFCATRLARGASVSRPPDEVVEEAVRLARRHPELVITGIHIGHYGRDLEPATSLAALCEALLGAVGARLRLSSIEATEIDDDLVRLLTESGGELAPHLHVPMQSGSDRVLRLMRRWHTREAYRDRLLEIAERVVPLGLGADIIVGFPGEDEDDFADTRALVQELPYTYLHVFPFSVRDDTVAASLPDRVPGDVAAARSRELREIGILKGERHRSGREGEVADVVVEGCGAEAVGVTGDYLKVAIEGPARPGDRFRGRLARRADRLAAVAASRVSGRRPGRRRGPPASAPTRS